MYKGERLNSSTHLIGALLAVAGLVLLIVKSSAEGDPWKITAFIIYGSSLFLLYASSTLYHSIKNRSAKHFFKKMDHNSIYLLIAGTYTPFTIVTLRGPWGWSIFGIVWGLAAAGMIVDAIPGFAKEHRILPLVIYLVMGWIGIIAAHPLVNVFPQTGAWMILAGGLFYTAGVVFYVFDKKIRHFHGIWHLFVLAGSIIHFIAVYQFV